MNAIVGDAVGWFKTMTTNAYIRGVKQYNWPRFNKRLWQKNYWEHIIRNDQAYKNITRYIRENPIRWDEEEFKKEYRRDLKSGS